MSFAAMLLFGFSQESRRTGIVSIMQAAVVDARSGRVMSTLFLFTQIAGGFGTMAVGLTAHNTGRRAPLIGSAMALTVVWLVMLGRRKTISAAFGAEDDELSAQREARPANAGRPQRATCRGRPPTGRSCRATGDHLSRMARISAARASAGTTGKTPGLIAGSLRR